MQATEHILNRIAGIFATMLLLGFSSVALAQGFTVQPMRMEVSPRAGQNLELSVQINNTSAEFVQVIELRLVELSQTPAGAWQVSDRSQSTSTEVSALDWITLTDEALEIAPASAAQTTLTVDVPRNAQGAYFAALLVETPRPENATGLIIRVRFLIPVIIQIQGRPVRLQVRLDDASMVYTPAEVGIGASTTAQLHILNAGRTYSRVWGQLLMEMKRGERWHPVTRIEIPERGIMPGVELRLGEDLSRSVPSGDYRLRGDLWVDGRRIAPIEKEIAFEGDPNAKDLALDTPLILSPEIVQMEMSPGATRTTVVSIENPGSDPVKVHIEASLPNDLQGVALGELRGDAFSAVPWTQIRPADFVIPAGRRQNIRVISRMPREGADLPNYYADLVLRGTYEEGDSAGKTQSVVHLTNKGLESKPAGAVEEIQVAEDDGPSKYIVQAKFVNLGSVHLEPTALLQLLDGRGEVLRAELSSESGLLLPLGKRAFGGSIDFSKVEPGLYVLRATIGEAGLSSAKQLLIQIGEGPALADGSTAARVVTVLDEDADIELQVGETLPSLPGETDDSQEATVQ